MSREIWLGLQRKRVLEKAKTIRVEPKLSPEVEKGLFDLYQMEKENEK